VLRGVSLERSEFYKGRKKSSSPEKLAVAANALIDIAGTNNFQQLLLNF